MQIYGLTDPRDDALRYVGKTEKLLKKRLGVHCASKEKNHRGNWIRSLVKEGLVPEIFCIEEIPDKNWQHEERFWISYFRSIGCDLVNGTDGGDGMSNPSLETRAKLKVSHVKQWQRPNMREKIVGSLRENWANSTEEQKKEHGRKTKEGKKGKHYQTFLGKHHTDEWCKMMNKAVTESNIRRTGSKNTLKSKLLKSMAAIMRYLPYTGA